MSIKKHIQFGAAILAIGVAFTSCSKEDFSSAKAKQNANNYDTRSLEITDGDMDAYIELDSESHGFNYRDGANDIISHGNNGGNSSGTATSRPDGGGPGNDDNGGGSIGDAEDLGESGTSKNKPKGNSGSN